MLLPPYPRYLLITAIVAVAVSAVIAATTSIPFWVACADLLFAGPITDLLGERIQRQNPQLTDRQQPFRRSGSVLIAWLAALAVVCALLAYFQHTSFWLLYCSGFLLLMFAGALNGLVIELENNAPGGWLNPNGKEPIRDEPRLESVGFAVRYV